MGERPDELAAVLIGTAQELTGTSVLVDVPLMSVGLDSLSTAELAT